MAGSQVGVAAVVESGGLRATLYRSRRRTLSIQLEPERGLVMRAPYGASVATLRDFLERRRPWIERQSLRLERQAAADPAPRWVSGEPLPFLGGRIALKVERGTTAKARLSGSLLIAAVPFPEDAEQVASAVSRLYAREAARLFPVYLGECLAAPTAIGLPRPELRLRSMRSRWGSCDTARRIVTLNTNLVRRDPELIRYVIMHELAHLRFRCHDEAFYELLGRLCPGWERLRAALALVRP
jgi:predicted metal-dependent hydrolase